jgi:hypothetical protein
MNLVPTTPSTAPNHWCTWNRQYAAALTTEGYGLLDGAGAQMARDALHREALDAWLASLHPRARSDLLVVLDDGWDLPLASAEEQKPWFGMLEPHADRFPGGFADIATTVARTGWRGFGAWVCVQEPKRLFTGWGAMPAEREAWWTGAAQRFQAAGGAYWKCDWGACSRDEEVRRLIARVARAHAPGLWVEHTTCRWPLNDWQRTCRLGKDLAAAGRTTLGYSDVYRTYDVLTPLSVPTTLERVARLLAGARIEPGARGLLHAEDEVYIGAVLGCVLGVMRFPRPDGLDGRQFPVFPERFECGRAIMSAQDEVARAVRWARIAPAWSAGGETTLLDAEYLEDAWTFAPGDTTFSPVIGSTIQQCAPARIARGLPLPEVASAGAAPYVAVSRHPAGACAVGMFGRTSPDGWRIPLADVTMDVGDAPGPVGVFGHCRQLTILGSGIVEGMRIVAQDLLADIADDITGAVSMAPGRLTIPGDVLRRIGTAAAATGDRSEPGVIVAWVPRH